jgi:hypothetical protein
MVGEIKKFNSKKVIGRLDRDKYHVLIDLRVGLYFFINSNNFSGSMKITKADWPQMPNQESYMRISLTGWTLTKRRSDPPSAARTRSGQKRNRGIHRKGRPC